MRTPFPQYGVTVFAYWCLRKKKKSIKFMGRAESFDGDAGNQTWIPLRKQSRSKLCHILHEMMMLHYSFCLLKVIKISTLTTWSRG